MADIVAEQYGSGRILKNKAKGQWRIVGSNIHLTATSAGKNSKEMKIWLRYRRHHSG